MPWLRLETISYQSDLSEIAHAIHDRVLKGHVGSQDDMWESIHFRIGRDTHLDVW